MQARVITVCSPQCSLHLVAVKFKFQHFSTMSNFSVGVPIVKLVPDVAFAPVLEVSPHPHSSLGASSNPHSPTGYTSLVHECEV